MNDAWNAMCCGQRRADAIPASEIRRCRGVYRGMWMQGEAYAAGDVVFICEEYEMPGSGSLYLALRTHCASLEDRPEYGMEWPTTWRIRLKPGQVDDLVGG